MKCGTSIALFIQVNETGPSNNSLIGTSAPMCFMRTLIVRPSSEIFSGGQPKMQLSLGAFGSASVMSTKPLESCCSKIDTHGGEDT
jgi:hypothetical protein